MIDPIIDEESHQRALKRIEALWDCVSGSREEHELDALATLVDAWERKRYPISTLDPIDAIEARCEQLGWTRKNLEPLMGSRARVSEVLGRKRALTLPMIRKIHEAMQIPADILITRSVSGARPPRRTSGRPTPGKTPKRAA